jgi:flagella basal body P-ring formation protein FlgA
VVRAAAQAVGQTLRRQATAGQPLALGDLSRTPMVQKGARVTMRLTGPGLSAVATGQAMEPGSGGERIRVLNTASRAIVEAEVVSAEEVRVLPGSQPILPGNGRVAQLANPNWSNQ